MLLYHGTSTVHRPAIDEKGLDRPFATTSLDLAEYYAQEVCEEVGGEPAVCSFEARLDECGPDMAALQEPVVYGIDDIEFATGDEALEAILAHPGPLDAQASLDLVASVLLHEDVAPERIGWVE
jgi:hypothetical protein